MLPATTSGAPIGLLAAGGLLSLVTCLWVRAAPRQQQLAEQLWEDLPAWTATLLLIWQPLAQLVSVSWQHTQLSVLKGVSATESLP